MKAKWLTAAAMAAGIFILGVLGARLMPSWIATHITLGLAFGLPVLGLLLLWRTGLVSFGHALYFGIGGYSVAVLNKAFGITEMVAYVLTGAIVAAATAFAVGFIVRVYRGIYFAMLNLAFSMVLYGILVKDKTFGSTDGFAIAAPSYFGFQPPNLEWAGAILLGSLAVICYVSAKLIHEYLETTLGQLAAAIRDNEVRVEYLGYSVARAVHVKYVLSALLASLGGVFAAVSSGQVDPDSMVNWTVSGEFVIITIFSGAGSVIAPFVGAVIFELLHTYALQYVPLYWQAIIGLILIVVILFAPAGIWSLGRIKWRTR